MGGKGDSVVRTVAMIHAVLPAIPPISEMLARELPGTRVINLLDEGLLAELERYGATSERPIKRLSMLVELGLDAGADAILVTCTAYTPLVDEVRSQHPSKPIISVDRAMVEEAVRIANRIGIIATVPAGLKQQQQLILQAAEAVNKRVTLVTSLHPEAFDALAGGKPDVHDDILLTALPGLARQVEVVLLAQVSMARLVPRLPDNLPVPVLSSPSFAVQELRRVTNCELSLSS
jgi:Asp/Glu/hydantoin racemase